MMMSMTHQEPTTKTIQATARESQMEVGCALTFASEATFEIEAKTTLRLEAKKKPDFT